MKGFTLIEMVLAISLVAIIGVIASRQLVAIFQSYDKAETESRIQQTGNNLLSVVTDEIKNGSVFSVIDSGSGLRFNRRGVGEDIWEFALKTDPDCSAYSNYLSFAKENGDSPLSPRDTIKGVTVACAGSCFVENADNTITVSLALSQACGAPARAQLQGSTEFTATVKPRSIYSE